MCGQAPTLEAFCNNDAASTCQVKCYQDSFYNVSAVNHHVVLHPPEQEIRKSILYYLQEKAKSPMTTSAILVLPTSRGIKKPWTPLLQGMELLKQYSNSDRIFRSGPDGGRLYSYGGRTDVWYDPPTQVTPESNPRIMATGSRRSGTLFASKVSGKTAIALVDTGAEDSFIDAAFLRSTGISIPANQPPVGDAVGAGSQTVRILGKVHVPLRMGAYSANIELQVVQDLLPGVDIVLGESWQVANKVIIDPARRRIQIQTPGRKGCVVRSLNSSRTQTISSVRSFLTRSRNETTPVSVISAKRAMKALKQGAEHMLVHVRHRPPQPQTHLAAVSPWHETKALKRKAPAVSGTPRDTETDPSPLHTQRDRHVGARYPRHRAHTYAAPTPGGNQGGYSRASCRSTPENAERRDPEAERVSSVISQSKGDPQAGKSVPAPPQNDEGPHTPGLIDPQLLDQLLTEYQDVFPEELPPGLPPDRDTGHVIPLEPNSIPPYRRNRRMSPNEVD